MDDTLKSKAKALPRDSPVNELRFLIHMYGDGETTLEQLIRFVRRNGK